MENTVLGNPIEGEVLPISDVKDEAFASEALGKGFAIEPTEGSVVAPFDGEAVTIFPSKHAIGLVSETGVEVLIHVGLNTVELDGKYFEAFVESGQPIKKGQLLLTFELEKIKEAGYVTQVPIVVTNTPQYSDFEILAQGQTEKEKDVFSVNV
ncbi:hypothetical protein GCM10008931_34220 [Oceanobacillus oncorhynchi subsp. oncorhynchi]|uniref:PTS sugar transporter subunit IIA n=1 Tax=Oceanobacillus oncorhynchi TaxID=545501 RepID=UPI0031E2AACD